MICRYQMNDPMLQHALSTDTLSGIRIEESLNSQFSTPENRITDRQVFYNCIIILYVVLCIVLYLKFKSLVTEVILILMMTAGTALLDWTWTS